MIRRKWKNCDKCKNDVPVLWRDGKCKWCCQREDAEEMLLGKVNPAVKKSEERVSQHAKNKAYYRWAIAENINRNKGKARCQECNEVIDNPVGRNVHHIIGYGANKMLYLEKENHFLLGLGPIYNQKCNCGTRYDEGPDQKGMNIWPESEKRKIELKRKYYNVTTS